MKWLTHHVLWMSKEKERENRIEKCLYVIVSFKPSFVAAYLSTQLWISFSDICIQCFVLFRHHYKCMCISLLLTSAMIASLSTWLHTPMWLLFGVYEVEKSWIFWKIPKKFETKMELFTLNSHISIEIRVQKASARATEETFCLQMTTIRASKWIRPR